MNLLTQIVSIFVQVFIGYLRALFEILKIKNIVDGIREQMMASFFGVPVWLITLITSLITIVSLAWLLIKKISRNYLRY